MHNKLTIFLGILVLLFGCNKKFSKDFNQNIQDLNKFQTFTEVQGNAKPLDTVNAIQHKYCKRADIHFKELTFRNLSLLLSRIYNTQINITQNPELLITLNYSNICLEDLLDQLGGLYNIGYTKNNFGYNLDYKTLKTKFFTVSYHNFKRSGSSTTSIQGGSSLSSSTSSNSGQTTIQTHTEDNFWTNIAQNLNILLGVVGQTNTSLTSNPTASDGDPSYSIYKESGIIVVSAFPKPMKNVEKFIKKINNICSKQVHIEAKILEVTLSNEFSTGIDWGILKNLVHFSAGTSIDSQLNMSMPEARMTITATNQNTFKSTINALSTQGKVSVLSSPKISVLNNQKAVFKFGEDQYYITGVSSSTAASSNSSSSSSSNSNTNAIATPTLTALFSGISLDATPTITHNNQVIMHVHPTVTDINTENRTFTLSGQSSELPLASIDTREADTVVKARSGDIIVVGGLMQNSVSSIRSSPNIKFKFLERLFGTKQEYVERKELVLLLRPVVVDNETTKPDFERYLLDGEGEIIEKRPSIVEFDE